MFNKNHQVLFYFSPVGYLSIKVVRGLSKIFTENHQISWIKSTCERILISRARGSEDTRKIAKKIN